MDRNSRYAAQGLVHPTATDPVSVVRHLLAVQAQDPRGMRLAIRPRSVGVRSVDLERALTEDRALVMSTLMRGTLHLVAAEDYWWLHRLVTPTLAAANRRRLHQEGVCDEQAERAMEVFAAEVSRGPRSRAQLRRAAQEAGIPVAGQALPHLVMLASNRGLLLRGPVLDGRGGGVGEQGFVAAHDWIGPPAYADLEEDLGRLAAGYLRAHPWSTDADLAAWAGITLGRARRAITVAGDSLVERDGSWAPADPEESTRSDLGDLPPPLLLGPFDPLLHGWRDRSFVLGPHTSLVTSNGLFRAFILLDGRAVGTWHLRDRRVDLELFEPIDPVATAALEAERLDVLDYLGRG